MATHGSLMPSIPAIGSPGIEIVTRGLNTLNGGPENTVSQPRCGMKLPVKSIRLDSAGTSETQTQFCSRMNPGRGEAIRFTRIVFTALYAPQHSLLS
jgi:hypothetical protein